VTALLMTHDPGDDPRLLVPLSIGIKRDFSRPRALITMPSMPPGVPGALAVMPQRSFIFGHSNESSDGDVLGVPTAGQWFFVPGLKLFALMQPAPAKARASCKPSARSVGA
jgi:hypothetical protein